MTLRHWLARSKVKNQKLAFVIKIQTKWVFFGTSDKMIYLLRSRGKKPKHIKDFKPIFENVIIELITKIIINCSYHIWMEAQITLAQHVTIIPIQFKNSGLELLGPWEAWVYDLLNKARDIKSELWRAEVQDHTSKG